MSVAIADLEDGFPSRLRLSQASQRESHLPVLLCETPGLLIRVFPSAPFLPRRFWRSEVLTALVPEVVVVKSSAPRDFPVVGGWSDHLVPIWLGPRQAGQVGPAAVLRPRAGCPVGRASWSSGSVASMSRLPGW